MTVAEKKKFEELEEEIRSLQDRVYELESHPALSTHLARNIENVRRRLRLFVRLRLALHSLPVFVKSARKRLASFMTRCATKLEGGETTHA